MTGTALQDWPSEQPTAAELLRYYAPRLAWAVAAAHGSAGYSVRHRIIAHDFGVYNEIAGVYATYVTLDALHRLDPDTADKIAAQIWGMAEAGDLYGETAVDLCAQRGIDAEWIARDGYSYGHKLARTQHETGRHLLELPERRSR